MLRSPSPHTRALLDPNRPSSSTYRAVRAARASVSHAGLKTTAQRGTGTKVIRDCCERVQKGVTVIDISAPVLQRTLTKNKYVLRHEGQTQHEPNEVGREERVARPAFTLHSGAYFWLLCELHTELLVRGDERAFAGDLS